MPDARNPLSGDAVDPFAAAGLSGHPACRMAAASLGVAGVPGQLTSAEHLRLERMKSPPRRAEMQGSFKVRRALIAGITGCLPEEVSMDTQQDGAPVLLTPPGWTVSLANKDRHTIVALARAPSAIGVDIEIVRTMNWKPALAMISSDAERRDVETAPGDVESNMRMFFRIWTLKEAALKSTGRGFRAGPKAVETPLSIVSAPGSGTMLAFGSAFDFWTADAGDAVVSLVRQRT